MKKNIFIAIILFLFVTEYFAQTELSKEERLSWFNNAKLGIFIHWGIYSVDGIGASWPMKWKKISWNDYMAQAKGFTAKNYNPNNWAQLFKKAGAKYVVLTSKHHDGFALWDTKYSLLNAKKYSAAQKDLLKPYAEAMRSAGLKVGFYFSLLDWSHKDYEVVFDRPQKILEELYPQPTWQANLSPRERFLKFVSGQLSELSHNYRPDIFWFDGGWERSSQWWYAEAIKDSLLTWNNKVIINDRLPDYGDYETAEQGMPILRPKSPWEFCMTLNNHWGYAPNDNNYKPDAQIVRTFVEVLSKGGNLLLDVGPKSDGTIDVRQVKMLENLGSWINRNKNFVYETIAGLPDGHFYGPTLLSSDSTKIYLALFDTPKDYILLQGIYNKIKKVTLLSNDRTLAFSRSGGAKWAHIPGILRIETPTEKECDKYVTIVVVELQDKVKLYRGGGKHIEEN